MYDAEQTYENFTEQQSNFITEIVLFPLVIKYANVDNLKGGCGFFKIKTPRFRVSPKISS